MAHGVGKSTSGPGQGHLQVSDVLECLTARAVVKSTSGLGQAKSDVFNGCQCVYGARCFQGHFWPWVKQKFLALPYVLSCTVF